MKIAFFNSKPYDEKFFNAVNETYNHHIHYFEVHLNEKTAKLAAGFDAVCAFVNDTVDKAVLEQLKAVGISFLALRCAGFNNVDLDAAGQLGITVVRVPAYSPAAVAEHAIGLMMSLNRKFHRSYNRVREGNFSLSGLVGFDMKGKTVGIVGTGKIGVSLAPILNGFGCKVLAYDVKENPEILAMDIPYVSLEDLFAQSDIISLHCPLFKETYHMINADSLCLMKPGVMIINTSRGGLIDTAALIQGLKNKTIGSVGLDVYEEEDSLFFEDLSGTIIDDDIFTRLVTFPNVLITGHQAFLTENALKNIADTTLSNLTTLEQGNPCDNTVALSPA
ncbi:MAG: 2-hydroxyacid dehydrogenase [Cyanobacteria bacterium P01_H01_bin.74]